MSLLKRGKKKEQNGLLEPPAASSPRLFRKSASIETGEDRPPSQNEGRKKKMLPSFLSNLFRDPPPKIVEVEPPFPDNAVVRAGAGRALSHESINSVLSSSSFSYVDPAVMGGKSKKGKRIPVDDPAYGSTTATPPSSSDKGTGAGVVVGEEKKGGLSSTLDKIGIKIGLKKKYNLQSCESLQYIDACEDNMPVVGVANRGRPRQPSVDTLVAPMAPPPPPPVVNASASPKPEKKEVVVTPSSSKATPTVIPTVVQDIPPPLPDSPPPEEKVDSPKPKRSPLLYRVLPGKRKTSKTFSESYVQTTITTQAVKNATPPSTPPQPPHTSTTPASPSPPKVETPITSSQKVETPTTPPSEATPPQKVNALAEHPKTPPEKPKTVAVPETPTPKTDEPVNPFDAEEPQPSTSAAAFGKITGNSNTWSNSGRRKRKAPLPPLLVGQTSVLGDVVSDVPTSTSQAAQLTRFTRIEESPPRQPSTSRGCGTFEIRPRKKERSVEPPPVAGPSGGRTAAGTNTLFSPNRYQQHKRSCSEGMNTAGRIHKPGKKKAPAPPNPFGDPDTPEETSSQLPPTAPPKLNRRRSVSRPPGERDSRPVSLIEPSVTATNPFESEEPAPPPPVALPPAPEPEVPSTVPPIQGEENGTPPVAPPAPDATSPADPEVDEVIRQNMLNDQQEKQQLGLQTSEQPVSTATTCDTSSPATAPSSSSRPPTETDLQVAQRTLEVLAASITTPIATPTPSTSTSSGTTTTSTSASENRAKLSELKREADRSPLNVLRSSNKSRPVSTSSSIYESPLALLLGKATGSSGGGGESSGGESTSPKVSHRPWYGALARQLTPKKQPTHPVKPFTALVKFSELDKEAARIVEENRRKSAEQRQLEIEQEMLELWDMEERPRENGVESAAPSTTTPTAAPAAQPTRISTTAQVHQVAAEVERPAPPPASAEVATASTSSPPHSPTFQSVHAASKHRKIKPLLLSSSPITNVRAEKLAIVQPQTSSSSSRTETAESSPTSVSSESRIPPTSPTTTTAPASSSSTSTTVTTTASSTPSTPTSRSSTAPEWDCPRCTLKNPSWRILCEICFQRRDPPPPVSSASSLMASILQRVNAEATAGRSAALSRTTTTSTSTTVATTSSKSVLSPPSTSVTTTTPTSSSASTSTTSSATASIPSVVEDYRPSKPAGPPPCENFLSQLPPKEDLLKSEKLSSLRRLHSDPDLEELDIGQLRRARLAYFQKQHSTPTPSSSSTPPKKNDLGSSSFADNEDDFLDIIIQPTTTVANITATTPSPPPTSNGGGAHSPSPLRYRPQLEAIREGHSHEYSALCYSSSEIAQIYENWQHDKDNRQCISSSSPIPSRFSHLPTSSSLLQTAPLFPYAPAPLIMMPGAAAPLLAAAEHQPPFAKNRLSASPTENYANSTTDNLPHHQGNSCANFVPGNVIMSGGRGGFSYEDYRRMGAIPKGFSGRRNPSEEWSSETSSSESSRGFGSRAPAFLPPGDSSPGITRRGVLDLPGYAASAEQSLAVSKLMKTLEGAIAAGDHRLAATLAHDLALMKANCVVGKINQPFSIRVYVEDRFMQQGPFLVQVSPLMTVRDLKDKIQRDWGIPAGFQKWILGRQMAEEESQSLSNFELTQDSMAFLFLVTPGAVGGVLEKKVTNGETPQQPTYNNLEKEASPPPPLPSKREAIPKNLPPAGPSSTSKAPGAVPKRGKRAVTPETLSAATALSQSLQQKLSEFKAVAEQTFGKVNNVAPSPVKPARSKEMSPAPPATPRIRSHESSPRRKIEVESKPVRKSAKSQSGSKEKIGDKSSRAGSVEKPPRGNTPTPAAPPKSPTPTAAPKSPTPAPPPKSPTPIIPENRFNGVLLQTPQEGENVQPPERTDRPKTPAKKETPCQTETIVVKKESESEKAASPQPEENHVEKFEQVVSVSPAPVDIVKVEETVEIEIATVAAAPQPQPKPKPRGIKKQNTVEKAPAETEVTAAPPKPLPRTLSSNVTAAAVDIRPMSPPKKEENVPKSPEKVTLDDACQTTLPFPAPKHKAVAPASAPESTLLRPSAFVSRPSTSTSAAAVAIAHVQPLPSSPPLPSISSFSPPSTDSAADPKPKAEDEPAPPAPQAPPPSFLSMLELMEKLDLIPTAEPADCPVCFSALAPGDGIVLRDCLHIFCRECLVGCVQYADESQVKCPYRDADYSCNNNLQEREIKALVPPEVFEKYLARSVKLAESKIVNTFHCKTPDCTGWCVFEDDVNVFLCPVCKHRNCLTCAAIHEGVDCQKYQRELAIAAETDEDAKQSRLMLEKMIQRGEALDCPACHVVLLKKWGCDWVRCSYCKTEICWVTKGFRWGPGGKGDVSGGCKCGVNGVKCHPKCTYCH